MKYNIDELEIYFEALLDLAREITQSVALSPVRVIITDAEALVTLIQHIDEWRKQQ